MFKAILLAFYFYSNHDVSCLVCGFKIYIFIKNVIKVYDILWLKLVLYFRVLDDVDGFVRTLADTPLLWDIQHKDYGNIPARQQTWLMLSGAFGITVAEAKAHYKGLRDKYRREKKLLIETPSRKRWEYLDLLTFFDDGKSPPLLELSTDSPNSSFGLFPLSSNVSQIKTNGYGESTQGHTTINPFQRPGNWNITRAQRLSSSSSTPINPPPPLKRSRESSVNSRLTMADDANTSRTATTSISVGSFIDQLISQEPKDSRERFSMDILDAVIQLKRTYITDRENVAMTINLSDDDE